ncbi:RPII140-upstream gene protein isoform X2 [Aplysia californica]|uniref:Complex I assembly factor TIMMDC1, mitochondrial n=1 Tax=Aplysia californica TaxID=6500 RepID=A0ABM1A4F8_APLCA|nr:RPII140-upstream gene protein isoform X2 [Aplysia californica]
MAFVLFSWTENSDVNMEEIAGCQLYWNAARFELNTAAPTINSGCGKSKLLANYEPHTLTHCELRADQVSGRTSPSFSWLLKLFSFQKLNAEEKTVEEPVSTQANSNHSLAERKENEQVEEHVPSPELEALARAYVQRETGMERVHMIFQKDHKGNSSPEMDYIKLALVQTLIITFFMKYVPAWNIARREFIRQNQATVFRTRIEAVRRMQDHVSFTAAIQGGAFSAKVTTFSAAFLVLSQMIASYRNKTSVLEYTAAAGIAGGFARIHLGFRGMIVGSALGATLGSLLGGFALLTMKAYGFTQEERHLATIMSKLEVEKSIVGDPEFQKKVKELMEENDLVS